MAALREKLMAGLKVEPGSRARLDKRRTDWAFDKALCDSEQEYVKGRAAQLLEHDRQELAVFQEVLYASKTKAILLCLQAMDAGGKDGTIRHVMSGVNPQGCHVMSFKQPSTLELSHDFLWRYQARLPARGMIGIFNRSHYEDVLIVQVHPELVENVLPSSPKKRQKFWEHRYKSINDWERHLARNGTVILKCFLHLSKDEQRKRFLKRLDEPAKQWKFSDSDIRERRRWDDYMAVYEEVLTATSTEWAPWWVIPADHKWIARSAVANLLASAMEDLDLKFPTVGPEKKEAIKAARRELEGEGKGKGKGRSKDQLVRPGLNA
jgi:PPK2 family polyphosphate:nucleotide phosphotransferase